MLYSKKYLDMAIYRWVRYFGNDEKWSRASKLKTIAYGSSSRMACIHNCTNCEAL
jgi:hypothetical protein